MKRPLVREIVKEAVLYGDANQDNEPSKKRAPETSRGTEATKNVGKAVGTDPNKVEYKKRDAPSSAEPTLESHYELSPLMSKMLEAELQDVMIKIWQSLPDDPPDHADNLVAKKFRNKAGDEFRNILGLNVTERLLNIHNTLYVKIVFAEKPLRANLATFVQKYNVRALKRLGDRGVNFAAKMRNFQDFDELCSNKKLRCGNIRVTVTPCYQFATCPPNLRTCYDTKGNSKLNKNIGNAMTKANSATNSEQETKPRSKEANNEDKLTTKAGKNVGPNESKKSKLIEKDTAVQQNVPPKVAAAKPNPPADGKIATKGASTEVYQTESVNKASPKVIPNKKNVPATESEQAAAKIIRDKSTTNVKQKENPSPCVTPAKLKSAETLKPNPVAKVPLTNPSEAASENLTPTAKSSKPNPAAKVTPDKSAPTNNQAKVTPAKPIATNNNQPKVTPAKPEATNNQPKATPAKPAATNNQPKATPAKPAATNNQPKATPAKTAATNNQPKATPAKPAATNNQPKATPAKTAATNNQPKATPTKPAATNNQPKATPAKPEATNNQPKATPAKPAATNNQAEVTPAKPLMTNNNQPKVTPSKPPATNNQAKVAPAKTIPTHNKKPKAPPAKPASSKTANNPKIVPKTAANTNKAPSNKLNAATKVGSQPKQKQISPKKTHERDYDELDDHDILAMLSGGIVLDECSGSDVE